MAGRRRQAGVKRGQGDGSIFRDGDRWVAAITVATVNGRQLRRRRWAATYDEARAKLRQLQHDKAAGLTGDADQPLRQLLDNWEQHVMPARGLSKATEDNYRSVIRTHIVPTIGHVRLCDLRAEDIDRLLQTMADAGKARSTIRLVRIVLGMALTHAERRELVTRNVARLAIVPPAPVRRSRALTHAQATAFLAAARSHRLEAAWMIMLCLGLRPGEVTGLLWDDVDLDRAVLHVRRAVRREDGRLLLGSPKTRRSRRSLDMPQPVVDALRSHQLRQKAERAAAGGGWQEHGLVFASAAGTILDPRNFRRAFDQVTDAAGLGRWHPHELRHSAISLLSDAGVPLERIADLAGHSTTYMTGTVYRHQLTPTVDAAKAPMERLFGDRPGRSEEAGDRPGSQGNRAGTTTSSDLC